MHHVNVLRGTSKRFLQRCISNGCQYDDNFKLKVPQFQNVMKATCHSDSASDLVKLREHISLLYGKISAFQPIPGQPESCFLSFRTQQSRYHALHAAVNNYSFEPIHFPFKRNLFPLIAVVSIRTNLHRVGAVANYIEDKAGQPNSFNFEVQKTAVKGDNISNIFFVFHDPEIFERVVPDSLVHNIPGKYLLRENFKRKLVRRYDDIKVSDALLYRYLPMYLNNDLATMIKSLVIEWDAFKRVDQHWIFSIFNTLGSVKGFESAGKNKVRVHFDKLHEVPLFSAFTRHSLLGQSQLHLSLNENFRASIKVHIPQTEDNAIFEKLAPFARKNSVILHNVEPNCGMSNVEFVRGLFDGIQYNPGFISATYYPEERKMEVLLEHASYVQPVVDIINRCEKRYVWRNVEAEPCRNSSSKFSHCGESVVSWK